MKSIVKSSKGITLVSLSVAIIILVIITNILVYNAKDNVYIKKLKGMYNDIENLNDKVSSYYAKYGTLPTNLNTMEYHINKNGVPTFTSNNKNTKPGDADEGRFYIIDLKSMEGITLNYGKDYESVNEYITDSTKKETLEENLRDLYIVNETTHNIFYVQGIEVDGVTYYSPESNTKTDKITLQYSDGNDLTGNLKLPDGYKYVSGTKTNELTIEKIDKGTDYDPSTNSIEEYQYIWRNDRIANVERNSEDGTEELKVWHVENGEKQYDEDIIVNDIYGFCASVNANSGYFYKKVTKNYVDENVIYYPLNLGYWSPTSDNGYTYTDKNGDTAYIPAGFQVSRTQNMSTVYGGLVVRDADENEYVWINVPKELTKDAETSDAIENVLKEYAKDYKKDTVDIWYDSNGKTINDAGYNENDKGGCGLTLSEYNELKEKMLKSIKEHGGFYIGRYEAGTNTTVTTGDPSVQAETIKQNRGLPESKQDKYPYTWLTCSQSQQLAKMVLNNKNTDVQSSMMFGIQWNLVCKFIEVSGERTKNSILTDSVEWGNCVDSKFKVLRGAYSELSKYTWNNVNNEYNKNMSEAIICTTGITERNKTINIYDLEGNVWERTLETKEADVGAPCNVRGGSCDNFGILPVSGIGGWGTSTNFPSNDNMAFRITIF